MASSVFHLPGDPDASHVYGRYGNPTVEEAEADLGLLENADVVLFPSGMAAIAAVFFTVLKPGDTVLCHADGYYNARALLDAFVEPLGIGVRHCPTVNMAAADLEGVRLVLAETPSNPGLDVCDLAVLARRANAAGALLMVDNTMATPLCQRPLDLGAELSILADTKAMAGHSDILAGHIATRNAELAAKIRTWRRLSGSIVSPFDAFLLHRGLLTLELRIERANANALALAEFLQEQPSISGLRYPGLKGDPAHAVAARQMIRGYGPILSFVLQDRTTAERFIAAHDLAANTTSFGGVHTSAECRVRWGDDVPDGFIRFACGIEPTSDLLAATERAISAAIS